MPDEVSGRIQVDIVESGAGGVAGGTGGTSSGTGAAATQVASAKKSAASQAGILKSVTRFLPLLAAAGGIAMIAKKSKVMGTMTETISEILGTILDVFLMPLMPIFVKIMEAIAPLIPKLAEFADKLLTPLVNMLLPVVEKVATGIDWVGERLEGFNMDNFTEKMKEIFMMNFKLPWEEGFNWGDVLSGLTWAQYINPIRWPEFIARVLWNQFIVGFLWEQFIKPVVWDKWLAPIADAFYAHVILPIKNWWESIKPSWWPFGGESRQLGGYIPRTGMYYLHRGEEVRQAGGMSGAGGEVYVNNVWNVGLDNTVNIDEFMTEVENRMITMMTSVMRRVSA